jgi:non-heme chloroperoxidase
MEQTLATLLDRASRMGVALVFACLLSSAINVAAASAAAPWKDPSPHQAQFVAVEKAVQLEVLDWGGRGRPVMLLAASGSTAHEFDDFAPKLTDHFHVYGMTRRGFGRSGFVAGDYGADRLGKDVLKVLDALKLEKPILVGHSYAGSELSFMANHYPQRVAGVIYLDAAYVYAFDNGKGMSMAEFQQIVREPPAPPPTETDLSSLEALQNYIARSRGARLPVAELTQQWEVMPDGRVGQRRSFAGNAILMKGLEKYSDIPVPALVIFANPHSLGSWTLTTLDPPVRATIDAFSSQFQAFTQKQANAISKSVPTARVISIPNANHFVFITNEADVLREMHSFIATLH